MIRPRVLVVYPYLGIVGGGKVVAAWALQALRQEFQVTLGTLGPVDYEALNCNLGTSLRDGDFAIRIAPRGYRRLLRAMPTTGDLMEICLIARWARELDARERFDVLLSINGEMDFGRPGLQYVHYPWTYRRRQEIGLRWFHRVPGLLAAYRVACGWLAQGSDAGIRVNLSLANSTYVAGKIKDVHGMDSVILYPPVPGNFPVIPWEQRRSAAVAIGRMNGAKRWHMAVEIVDLVRSRGLDLGLTLINQPDDREYGRRIFALAASRPWFRILTGLTREELAREVAQHRYGIHAMEYEHFGIGVAEMVRAGCIPFVHDSGGPVEIVGGRSELRFRDAAEGASAMAAVMGDSDLRERIRPALAKQRHLFSAETFCDSLRKIVRSRCGPGKTSPRC